MRDAASGVLAQHIKNGGWSGLPCCCCCCSCCRRRRRRRRCCCCYCCVEIELSGKHAWSIFSRKQRRWVYGWNKMFPATNSLLSYCWGQSVAWEWHQPTPGGNIRWQPTSTTSSRWIAYLHPHPSSSSQQASVEHHGGVALLRCGRFHLSEKPHFNHPSFQPPTDPLLSPLAISSHVTCTSATVHVRERITCLGLPRASQRPSRTSGLLKL